VKRQYQGCRTSIAMRGSPCATLGIERWRVRRLLPPDAKHFVAGLSFSERTSSIRRAMDNQRTHTVIPSPALRLIAFDRRPWDDCRLPVPGVGAASANENA